MLEIKSTNVRPSKKIACTLYFVLTQAVKYKKISRFVREPEGHDPAVLHYTIFFCGEQKPFAVCVTRNPEVPLGKSKVKKLDRSCDITVSTLDTKKTATRIICEVFWKKLKDPIIVHRQRIQRVIDVCEINTPVFSEASAFTSHDNNKITADLSVMYNGIQVPLRIIPHVRRKRMRQYVQEGVAIIYFAGYDKYKKILKHITLACEEYTKQSSN